MSGCDPGQVLIEDPEGSAIQRSLRLGAECAQVGDAERIGIPVQEIGNLSDARARGGKVAAAELGGGEIDEDQHALAAWGLTR